MISSTSALSMYSVFPPGVKIYRALADEKDVTIVCQVLESKKYTILKIKHQDDIVHILYCKMVGKKKYYTI